MKVRLKIQLAGSDGEPFMGIGLVRLLKRIKKFKSITLAARDMRMSYAKAHHILKRLEKSLDHKMLVRRRGGADRGGARLTPFAEAFLKGYGDYQASVNKFAEKAFAGFLKAVMAPKH